MKKFSIFALSILIAAALLTACHGQSTNEDPAFKASPDFAIEKAEVKYDEALELLVFSITVKGQAGSSTPQPAGQLDGAPVIGYVFPTTLKPQDVGFSATEGILALAITSHPDFDDTPLWDENYDRDYQNDGVIWHPHWVVLGEDKRVPGGLAVKQFKKGDDSVTLPPTNPAMPMYMDSPGFAIVAKGNTISALVPTYRISGQSTFQYDGVAAYMQVNTSNEELPMLGVYNVYSVASGDLSLPYQVKQR